MPWATNEHDVWSITSKILLSGLSLDLEGNTAPEEGSVVWSIAPASESVLRKAFMCR